MAESKLTSKLDRDSAMVPAEHEIPTGGGPTSWPPTSADCNSPSASAADEGAIRNLRIEDGE
jgi:hypothetical protein